MFGKLRLVRYIFIGGKVYRFVTFHFERYIIKLVNSENFSRAYLKHVIRKMLALRAPWRFINNLQ